MKTKLVKIADIAIDGGTQQREKINEDIVVEYAESLKCGAKFPAVTLFFDGVQYYLADGFHRYWAHKAVDGMLDILADVHDGLKRDAVLFSASANGTHGIRLSNSDKRRSVLVLLNDKEWREWSDNKIAKHCHVTHPFVGKIRKELDTDGVVTVTTSARKPAPVLEVENDTSANSTDNEGAYNPADDEVAELADTVRALSAENDALKDRLAVEVMAVSEEEKTAAIDTIESLRSEVKQLEIALSAVTASRDSYQRENAELKVQLKMQRKQLDKARAA